MKSMKRVQWVKNTQNNNWFDFLRLNLNAPYFGGKKGVYVIWYSAPTIAKVIRLGSGILIDRLKEHRSNPEITKFSSSGQLKVSWIIADGINLRESELEGVEAYLSRVYSPLIGQRFPERYEIQVNLIGDK